MPQPRLDGALPAAAPGQAQGWGLQGWGLQGRGLQGPHAGKPGTWGPEHGWDECTRPIKSPCQLLAGGLISALTELGSQKLVGF